MEVIFYRFSTSLELHTQPATVDEQHMICFHFYVKILMLD
jgi:hypothetical protein